MAESLSPEIVEKVKALSKKYEGMGQDLGGYLDGLLHSKYLTYWDYIHLDTLLSLQTPKTDFEDERIFVIYHQITELYLNLIMHELSWLAKRAATVDPKKFLVKIKRVNNYMRALTESFVIMVDGMDPAQFLQFRMALLPSSGFQSAQFRELEIYCTDFDNLLHQDSRGKTKSIEDVEPLFEQIYWKFGATDSKTGKKTLTLRQFEEKYNRSLQELTANVFDSTVNHMLKRFTKDGVLSEEIKDELRSLDVLVNVDWRLAHYKSAVVYLKRSAPTELAATGGTNWQKYLPPRFQKIVFFPTLWNEEELTEWGKSWVQEQLDS
jgi:tryptophan 2,3-dioxygenase